MLFQFSNKSLFVIADVLNSNHIPPIVLMSIFFWGGVYVDGVLFALLLFVYLYVEGIDNSESE